MTGRGYIANPRRTRLICARDFVEILNKRAHRSIHALHLRILGFDYVIFVRSMGAISMTQSEMSGSQVQWLSGEDVARL